MAVKRIHVLPDFLANQIAAGEVIERPSSVLKELLENSLDAGASHIEITIEQSGIGLVRVQDDGVGIYEDDLRLAICPHATSKVQAAEDLEAIVSYGFRGEALASISAVSRLTIESCVSEQKTGFRIQREGRGSTPQMQPTPKRVGTTVEVSDLFYNTPARRKFLRSEKTELLHIEEVFKRIALSQPGVSFKYQVGTRQPKRLPKCTDQEGYQRRVSELCGKAFSQKAHYIEIEANGMSLSGWLCGQEDMRAQADLQYCYLNGRMVRDKLIMHAIRQAYQSTNVVGKHPAYVLLLTLDPARVDVNVHPTKHEVRFQESRAVHDFLVYAIGQGLGQESYVPEISEAPLSFEPKTFSKVGSDRVVTLLGDRLLLIQKDSILHFIQLKEARFAWAYEALRQGVSSRLLLEPKPMDIGSAANFLDDQYAFLKRLGFELSRISDTQVFVRTLPEVFPQEPKGLDKLLVTLLSVGSFDKAIEHVAKCVAEQNFSKEHTIALALALKHFDPKWSKQLTVTALESKIF